MYELRNGALKIAFPENGGGMPETITLLEADQTEVPVVTSGDYSFELELEDGTVLTPCAGEHFADEADGIKQIEFHHVKWENAEKKTVPGLLGSFCHELHPDGTMFTDGFFASSGTTPPGICRFELKIRLRLGKAEKLRWASFFRPQAADGTLIQTAAPERFIERNLPRVLENGIMPMVSFQTLQHNSPQLYTEFFMEGGNSISGKAEDNESSVTWQDGDPVIRWNFQKNPCRHHNLPWQWRNHWGFVIRNAPVKRHFPPMTLYHYFDNFRHYPDSECLRIMAECGCQVLAMHENWRLDVQNGGVPYDEKAFRELIENAHRLQIRVTPYIRGNENSVEEDHAGWFLHYLKKNFDGLYMDYGGPFHEITPPDECYQNGRIHFRRHYMKLRELRKTIGPDGVFYIHTGPLFSALGLNFADGYVSGEGEQGILLKGRTEHEYFSMSSAAHGTLWTAAFPEYGTPAIVPFLAAAGQAPHSTLGTQLRSSSLDHPSVPGLNDVVYRPLWKLWRIFRNEKDISVFNDFNARGKFDTGDPEFIGHCLMVSGGKSLLILSNFSPEKQNVRIRTPFLSGGNAVLLLNGKALPWKEEEFEMEGFGVAGILTGGSEEDLEDYLKPYPPLSERGKEILAEIQRQKFLRENPPRWADVSLRIRLAEIPGAPYEESLVYDLYSSEIVLYELGTGGEKRLLSRIGRLMFGEDSRTFHLSSLLPPGRHRLAVQSFYEGQPFYSLVEARLFNPEHPEEEYTVMFNNALDADRSILSWETEIR